MDRVPVRVPCPVCSAKVKVLVSVHYSHDGTSSSVGLMGSAEHVCAVAAK